MFGFFKKDADPEVFSPVTGRVYPLSACADAAFSSGALGAGVVFRYDGAYIAAPCCGTVASVAQTQHCITIRCDNGAELLIHVGLDTVMLGGSGLRALAAPRQRVRTGDRLIEIDRAFMAENGVDLTTPMVVLNADEVEVELCCSEGEVTEGATAVLQVRRK